MIDSDRKVVISYLPNDLHYHGMKSLLKDITPGIIPRNLVSDDSKIDSKGFSFTSYDTTEQAEIASTILDSMPLGND